MSETVDQATERVVDVFRGAGRKVKQNGAGYEVSCPGPIHAWGDRNPSLSINPGTKAVVVHCHTGDPTSVVLAEVNLTGADLFPVNGEAGKRIIATYDYTDEIGQLLSQVVRYDPKDFRNRRPGGPGEPEWIWNLKGTRRVPYRLPELLAAKEAVYYEGEKDADNGREGGLTATTSLGGAGKWRDEYVQYFTHLAKVTVIADRDDPGRAHARTVGASLQAAGVNVETAQPPDGCKDFSDMLAAELDLTYLEPLDDAEELPVVVPESGTLAELLGETIEPVRFVIAGLLPEGLTDLAGKPKLGKSWLALELSLAVCAGRDALGHTTTPADALYIALEDGKRRLQERVRILGGHHLPPEALSRFHYSTTWPTLDQGGLAQLEEWMDAHPNTRLIVIDTYGRIRGELPGRDRYAEEYQLLAPIQNFAVRHRIAVVFVHHLRKQGADDWIEQLSGSQAITAAADTILGLFHERGQMDATLRVVSREIDEKDLALRFDGGRWESMGDASLYRQSVERTAVLEALEGLGEGSASDIAPLVEKTPANVAKMLRGLAGEGLVTLIRRGVYSLNTRVVSVVSVESPTNETTQTTQTTHPHLGGDSDVTQSPCPDCGHHTPGMHFARCPQLPDPI